MNRRLYKSVFGRDGDLSRLCDLQRDYGASVILLSDCT
ncbi:hypothetical protein NSTCB13_01957 [Nostoc sp. DSM 114160]|jgi:hypothetical protein